MTTKKHPVLYTTNEVASILKVTKRTIFRYIEGGKLRASKNGIWRIKKEDLDKFIK